ncbi:MAG TPA: PAAR domain-containing protein [Paraburkholderia sp.]|nr:PAAR domain-containing protein [Paraburkholderia sp.]
MKSPIRKGDILEHGGEVAGGSPWFNVMGRPVARKGDEAICEQHGPTVIDEGYDKFPDRDGKPVAFHHYRCVCGCRLLSSLMNFNIE